MCHIGRVPQPYKGKLVESPVPLVCYLHCPSLPPVHDLILGITIYKAHPQDRHVVDKLEALLMPVKSHRKLSSVIHCNVRHKGNIAPWKGKGEHSRWIWPAQSYEISSNEQIMVCALQCVGDKQELWFLFNSQDELDLTPWSVHQGRKKFPFGINRLVVKFVCRWHNILFDKLVALLDWIILHKDPPETDWLSCANL